MNFQFSTSSLLLGLAVLFVITAVPVKLAASFIGASRQSFAASGIAVLVAGALAYPGYRLFGGAVLGLLGAFIGTAIGFWIVLRPSLFGAFGLTFVALVLQVAFLQLLAMF